MSDPENLQRERQDGLLFRYEGSATEPEPQLYTTTVPTAEMYNGDFSKWVDSAGNADSDLRSTHGEQSQRWRYAQAVPQ